MNRKNFLRTLISLIGSSLGYLFYNSISINSKIKSAQLNNFEYPNKFPNGITFVDDFIVSKNQDNIEIFPNKCTHLGCKIINYDGENLVCPCHGSKFSPTGKVINGPAIKDLKKINYRVDNSQNKIFINNES